MYTLYLCTFPKCSMNAICIFTDVIIGPQMVPLKDTNFQTSRQAGESLRGSGESTIRGFLGEVGWFETSSEMTYPPWN